MLNTVLQYMYWYTNIYWEYVQYVVYILDIH